MQNWALRKERECAECAVERERRCCVLKDTDADRQKYVTDPFDAAPYVHPFRHPSFHATQLRAIVFAKNKARRLLWVTAHDVVGNKNLIHGADHKQEARKERWLEFHDRFTGGIPGLLPLVLDLPIRFTESIGKKAREMGVFKHSRGYIRGWELPDAEVARLATMDDKEVVLQLRPTKLLIEVETATKLMPVVDGKSIFELTVQAKPWSLDKQGNVKMTRLGFPIVPDFGGTAHAYCGSTMPAALGDLLPWYKKIEH